ncbi:DNA-binding transcriptional regulator, LysR family [Paenibacillus catalpae]|uniref:DNA-binding transcriptional regulator, LysR family n=1 Tax=Paenibacillus catalpae TaxID=1045775 RepID=A0A1I2GVF1_9BACL|nr:LysR family transcriptional regulator [Paenibacillus catalpae]SFF21924.1 DNA-binding transcriptional regulator, LysR family [Paenibacillus catalpae]
MELVYLQTFCEVARRRSITRAAEELGYAQSSVTIQIQKLEKEYGAPLLERYGRQMRLTPPGEKLYTLAVQMLELYKQSKESVAGYAGGTLVIGAIDSLAAYFLPPYLRQLRQLFPELTIQLQPDRESHIIGKVKDGEYDIGLLLDAKPADSALECQALREEPLVLVAPAGHPLAGQPHIGLHDLNGLELIMSEESCVYRGMFEKVLQESGIAFTALFELGNPEAVKQCAVNGLGLALLPQMVVAEDIRQGRLVALPFSHPDIRFDLQYLIHPRKWMSQPLQTLIRLLGRGQE